MYTYTRMQRDCIDTNIYFSFNNNINIDIYIDYLERKVQYRVQHE